MVAKNKKSKKSKKEEHDLDKLSCLPDSILSYILSFLDTKSAIRTSLLSKRYKLLWTLTPSLDFVLSETETVYPNSYNDVVPPEHAKDPSIFFFQLYVNRILRLREHSNLTSFRLSLYKDVGMELLEKCMDYAAKHKVQDFRIRGYVKNQPVVLPELLLTSSSLTNLHLHNATPYSIRLPKSVLLPNLKFLHLKKFQFSDNNFNGGIFSGCPNLESLVLSRCSIRPRDEVKVLNLNFSNLVNLVIKCWRSPWICFNEHAINVNAPKLAFFKYQGHLARVNFNDSLLFLERACIELCYPTACTIVNLSERKQELAECFLSMLRYMCNVEFLSLSMKTIEVLSALPDLRERSHTIFENLRLIKFTAENKYTEKTLSIKTVMQLLENAATDVLISDGSKKKKPSPGYSKVKTNKKDDAKHIAVPVHVMYFLLENSPSAEFLSVEIPKISPSQV
ncbi:hypothetical protein ABFS83_03G119100 [Erythranthe nasuta]